MVTMEKGILGNAIRKARTDKKISQENLAELVGITPTHLKHIESEHRKPSIEVLFKLAKELHMSLDNIVFDTNSPKSEIYNSTLLLLKQCDEKQLKIVKSLIDALLEA